MKAILLFALACALVEGTVDPCPQTDHLYYDKSCCDGATQNCLDGILQTDKDAIDNLVDLKRADGSACTADDALKYSIDEAANFSGVVCADSGPPVNCVGTWSDYGACANGAKSRTYNVTTPASGGGTACPASPESAACNGTIGDACTQASHCASNTCDSGTSKCVAAPTFTLVTDDTGWDVNSPKLMTEQECKDMANDADLLSALQDAWTDSTTTLADLTFDLALKGHSQCGLYPKGCSLRLGNERLYWNDGLNAAGAACSNTNFVPTIPIPTDGASTYFPVLNP